MCHLFSATLHHFVAKLSTLSLASHKTAVLIIAEIVVLYLISLVTFDADPRFVTNQFSTIYSDFQVAIHVLLIQ